MQVQHRRRHREAAKTRKIEFDVPDSKGVSGRLQPPPCDAFIFQMVYFHGRGNKSSLFPTAWRKTTFVFWDNLILPHGSGGWHFPREYKARRRHLTILKIAKFVFNIFILLRNITLIYTFNENFIHKAICFHCKNTQIGLYNTYILTTHIKILSRIYQTDSTSNQFK